MLDVFFDRHFATKMVQYFISDGFIYRGMVDDFNNLFGDVFGIANLANLAIASFLNDFSDAGQVRANDRRSA